MIGFDCEGRISPAALLAAGCRDLFRYVTTPSWPKSITPAEYAEQTTAGIRVHLNDETTADFMLGGYQAGVEQARYSRARATAIGVDRVRATPAWPNPRRIFYSLDVGATAAQIDIAMEFLRGAADTDGKVNVAAYGEFAFVKAAMDAGYAGWGTVGWSQGRRDPRAFAWQTGEQRTIGGVRVDVNEMNPAALGAPVSQPPAPNPASPTSEDDMPAFATGEIKPGFGVTTIFCPPPAQKGMWGSLRISFGSDFGTAHLRVAAYIDGPGWTVFEDFAVPDAGDRVNPFGGLAPVGIQKVSVQRVRSGPADTADSIPVAYLIEAEAK